MAIKLEFDPAEMKTTPVEHTYEQAQKEQAILSKNRGGRPRKKESEKLPKKQQLVVYFTAEEMAQIDEFLHQENFVSRSSFVRKAILDLVENSKKDS